MLAAGAAPELHPGAVGSFVRNGVSYTVDVWENDDGLPQNSVFALTQTRDGYLWLGTANGLVRFDGLRFTVFDESNTRGLTSGHIVSLFEDGRSNLWVGTENAGVVWVRPGQGALPLLIGQGGPERRLLSACEDGSGVVWLYHANGELWRFSEDRFTPFLSSQGGGSSRAIIAEPGGPVWVGSERRQVALSPVAPGATVQLPVAQEIPVSRLDFLLASRANGYWRLADGRVQKWKASHMDVDLGAYPWGDARISSACEDGEGNLLVGTLGRGVYWFEPQGEAFHLSTAQGLSHNYVLSLHADPEGSIWVGTDGGGLNRIKRQLFELLEGTRGMVVQSVCEDNQGGSWIGSNGGGVLYARDGHIDRYGPERGLTNLFVRSVLVDREQRVWVGTWGAGLLRLREGRFERVAAQGPVHLVSALFQDRSGRLWIGTQGGLVLWHDAQPRVFTLRDGLSSDVIRGITEDGAGNLWIATIGGGLNCFRDGTFRAYRKRQGELPSDDLTALCVDAEGVLWIGTSASGLVRFDGRRWTVYSTREGLVSNAIGYLLEDGQGNLWVGSNAGLMRAPLRLLEEVADGVASRVHLRVFGRPDGLPTRECTSGSQPGAWHRPGGRLWFPTIKGLATADPARLRLNPRPPPVAVEAVLIEGQPQSTNLLRLGRWEEVVLPAGKQRLEIQFTSLNLGAPDQARFRFRLVGYEDDWTEAGGNRFALYPKLPPGRYTFRVTACNEDGLWNEAGVNLAVVVEPPFWRTWWFLGVSAAMLLGAIVLTVHRVSTWRLQREVEQFRQQETVERERSRIARDLHDQLGASLTQVALLGELAESDKDLPDEVATHARQISHTARDTTRMLDEIVWAVNPSNDTLEGLVNYVCKYTQEYLAIAGVRYRLEAPPQLPSAPILPEVRHNVFLAAKEAVTNVVRHAHASEVRIRLRVDSARFSLEIEDDGRGVAGLDPTAARLRNGLSNMRRRMEDVGGVFDIGPAPERGTRVCLTAPLRGN
jgi:ligand-binding sensor domain-containing protein/signal transduction histidine kinase